MRECLPVLARVVVVNAVDSIDATNISGTRAARVRGGEDDPIVSVGASVEAGMDSLSSRGVDERGRHIGVILDEVATCFELRSDCAWL